ncbi:AraC family transcriptional regulator [Paenibacillus koleovorans]|uniref:AraC family transcriptional regulator n=1 Tax=Paenibacillus koleovorans TaxID=121608 RepID=UPI000FD96E82|nr:AraC family transcriptional regulator [Paenibacillus koleovorans]
MSAKQSKLWYAKLGAPISIEYAKRTEPFTMPNEHFHEQYEIYYLFSGERYYFIGDHTYHIHSGDLVCIPSQELHKTSEATLPKHERIVIYFNESFVRENYSEHADLLLSPFHAPNPVYRFSAKDLILTESLFQQLLAELHTKPLGYEIRIQHTFVEVLLLAARHLRKQEPTLSPLESPLHQKISDITRHIRAHISADLSLSALAEQFYISPYYLSRTFKAVTGFTLTEYVHTARIRQAMQLLKDTELSILDISNQVGFVNFSHFGKIFKKITQLSPREYRKE